MEEIGIAMTDAWPAIVRNSFLGEWHGEHCEDRGVRAVKMCERPLRQRMQSDLPGDRFSAGTHLAAMYRSWWGT